MPRAALESVLNRTLLRRPVVLEQAHNPDRLARSFDHAVVLCHTAGHRNHGLRGGPALDEMRSAHHATTIRGLSGSLANEICICDRFHVERRFRISVLQLDVWMRLQVTGSALEHLPVRARSIRSAEKLHLAADRNRRPAEVVHPPRRLV